MINYCNIIYLNSSFQRQVEVTGLSYEFNDLTREKRSCRSIKQQKKMLSTEARPASTEALPAKVVVLIPAGYPLKLKGDDNYTTDSLITTDSPKLFEAYSKSQWSGLVVQRGDYLFDEMMFPDFAFKVVYVFPSQGEIVTETKIELQVPRRKSRKKVAMKKRDSVTSYYRISIDDVVGQEKAKEKIRIIYKFLSRKDLQNSEWFPKNILFHGPPGTGKTMLARALANEAGVEMISIKASDLIGIYVGEGSAKISKLYLKARQKKAPCIIFIDEADAIALKRHHQQTRGDVMEIVASLLGEMDGIESNRGIVTICATNLLSELDEAIKSRFEQMIEFTLPTSEERKEICRKKAVNSPVPFDVNWDLVAAKTEDWSGRDLFEKVLKAAIHKAILNDREEITTGDVLELIDASKKQEKIPGYQ
ncbi:MAG: AAA family ATPase [Candidatus Odinarchaeota archaeon]